MSTIFKCKMCGGDLELTENKGIAKCPYCGATQTLPNTNDEVISNLYNRANNLRLKGEFDRAEQIYESIVQKDDSQAEAHWGIVLCKYGIEYVEDPSTHKRIPTCHRASYEAIRADADYLAAIDYSNGEQQTIYETEARAIDRIQKGILEIAKEEKPFDVFICYKETDENGKRTVDSTIANDIYYQLSQEGFKVFYAAITLEDKLGQEYEPYIFAALNSAKVMLVLGTKPEYFSAVWVKNEWSRYLKLIKNDRNKLLIPCYRDMDAYDLPEEFAHLQAQDMSKIGFINDVVRGIRKVVGSDEESFETRNSSTAITSNVEPLLKRAFMFLEDEEWNRADDFAEQVLNQEPENAQAYFVKLLVDLRLKNKEELRNSKSIFDDNKNYQKAERFADPSFKRELESINNSVKEYVENIVKKEEERKLREWQDKTYSNAMKTMEQGVSEGDFENAAALFDELKDYKNSREQAELCRTKAQTIRENYGIVTIDFMANTTHDLSIKIDGSEVIKGMMSKGTQKSFKLPTGKHTVSMDFVVDKGDSKSFYLEKGDNKTIHISSKLFGLKMWM